MKAVVGCQWLAGSTVGLVHALLDLLTRGDYDGIGCDKDYAARVARRHAVAIIAVKYLLYPVPACTMLIPEFCVRAFILDPLRVGGDSVRTLCQGNAVHPGQVGIISVGVGVGFSPKFIHQYRPCLHGKN